MSTNSLPLDSTASSRKRSLILPLAILVILVAASFMASKWLFRKIGSEPFIYRQTATGWQKLPAPYGYPESLRVTSRGTVWLLIWGQSAFSRWNGTGWQNYTAADLGIGERMTARVLALDGEQVWTATEQGVVHFDGQTWSVDRSVTARFDAWTVAGTGEVWVIDSSGKLSHFAQGKWHSEKLLLPGITWSKEGVEAPQLARTEDGTVWLKRGGLWRGDGHSWNRITNGTNALEDAVLIGAAGRRVWLQDEGNVLSVSADGKQWATYPMNQAGLEGTFWVGDVTSSGDGTWFAASNGVMEFDGANWRRLPLPGPGMAGVRRVSAGPDGRLWIIVASVPRPVQDVRYILYLNIAIPILVLAAVVWLVVRYRKRQVQQHQRVTQAVQHATGDVPVELEAGAKTLSSTSVYGTLFLWIASIFGYVILRLIWPKAPYWSIAVIALALHLVITFRNSLVKRKPQPSDPIGPGAPSRYDWAKSWKAVASAIAILLLLNLDRFPNLRFLRGYWPWIFVLAPTVYHTIALHLLNRAAKRGDYDRALKIVRWAHFYNPSGMEPLRVTGHMLMLAGRYQEAEDALRRSFANQHATRSYAYALEYLGDALMEQGRWEEARRSYEAALHAVPWLRRANRGMAELILRHDPRPEDAFDYVEKILDFSGVSWMERKGNGRAVDDYWGLKAWALAQTGRTSEVADAIKKALSHTDKTSLPDMASSHYRAGMALQAMGKDSEAREHFNLAVQFDPQGRRGMLANRAIRESGVWGAVRV